MNNISSSLSLSLSLSIYLSLSLSPCACVSCMAAMPSSCRSVSFVFKTRARARSRRRNSQSCCSSATEKPSLRCRQVLVQAQRRRCLCKSGCAEQSRRTRPLGFILKGIFPLLYRRHDYPHEYLEKLIVMKTVHTIIVNTE